MNLAPSNQIHDLANRGVQESQFPKNQIEKEVV